MDTQRLIVRQVCLKGAIELLSSNTAVFTDEELIEKIQKLTNEFEKIITTEA